MSQYPDFNWIFVAMSESGKPIWARQQGRDHSSSDNGSSGSSCSATEHTMEAELSRLCGIVQALRTSILCSNSSDSLLGRLGDIQSLQSGSCSIVFLTVGAMTLMAIAQHGKATRKSDAARSCSDFVPTGDKEAFLRLQLEFIYSQIIFSVTEQVQHTLHQNPAFDLRNYLGPASDRVIRSLVDQGGLPGQIRGNPASFFSMAVESVFPLSPESRSNASHVLLRSASHDNTLYAILFLGGTSSKLITLVQPAFAPLQLRAADLQLLLHFVSRQMENNSSTPASTTTTAAASSNNSNATDLWLPICLSHVHAGGFLYCYAHNLLHANNDDAVAPLTLALISSHGTTEQFQLFRQMAQKIRYNLGIVGVMNITSRDNDDNINHTSSEDKKQQLQHHANDGGEEDYVDASGEGYGIIPYIPDDSHNLLEQLLGVHNTSRLDALLGNYLTLAEAWHFCFRLNVPVTSMVSTTISEGRSGKTTKPKSGDRHHLLTQCLSSQLDELAGGDGDGTCRQRRLWRAYQRLNLRLRIGSATAEASSNAFGKIQQDQYLDDTHHQRLGLSGVECPAMCLLEAPPNLEGITYMRLGADTFFGMSGRNFELYIATNRDAPAEKVAAAAAKLARQLLQDQRTLFLSDPLVWPEQTTTHNMHR